MRAIPERFLDAAATRKRGIWNWFCKKSVLGTEVAQKGVGQPVGVCFGKQEGVLDAGIARKRGS